MERMTVEEECGTAENKTVGGELVSDDGIFTVSIIIA